MTNNTSFNRENWFYLKEGHWVFRFTNDDIDKAQQAAFSCKQFMEDDEDEMIDDELRSCFNCMKRRWLIESFECRDVTAFS
ncbi:MULTISPECIES: hypothetical protein [Shewanella]|uniref:hypothetical protein n=1 Tax=Shewanella TaxID=22 RepID=UPI001BC10F86|nr:MULTISPECIES: hypothetical protein [Shewanella]GIU53616.1 hypothetical protein TUM4249_32570 [Shewanella sp. KT0246]